jgi:CheY-like chemotaxis protein
MGLVSGLFLVHWLTLAAFSMAGTIVYVLVSRWDWLLAPKWFALLAAFQLAYLAGAAIRVSWSDAGSRETGLAADEGQAFHGERILIVEDEPLVAAHLAEEVEAASGRPLGPAGSVAEALAIIAGGTVDAAVLDVRLADGNVTAVALELMERNVPFVVLTGVQPPPEIAGRRPEVPIFRKPVPLASPIRSLTEQVNRAGKPRKKGA